MTHRISAGTLAAILTLPMAIAAQDRLKTMPGYEAAQRMAQDAPAAITGAVLASRG